MTSDMQHKVNELQQKFDELGTLHEQVMSELNEVIEARSRATRLFGQTSVLVNVDDFLSPSYTETMRKLGKFGEMILRQMKVVQAQLAETRKEANNG